MILRVTAEYVCVNTAVVLAPFFVHLEVLYKFGYKPELHKRINNEIGKEVTKIRKAEGQKRRQAEANKTQ